MTAPEIRIGDAQRLAAQDHLQSAYAQGALDLDELEERLTRAMAAKTPSDLEPLVADLPPATPSGPQSEPSVDGPGPASLRRAGGTVVTAIALALLMVWIGRADAVSIFSSSTYAVTADQLAEHAADTDGPLEVRVLSLFGSVEVTVPERSDVRSRAIAIMGSVECSACRNATATDVPTIEIGGTSIFGSVEITGQ